MVKICRRLKWMVPKPHFQKIMKIKNIYQNRFVVESLTCVGDAVSNNEFEVGNNVGISRLWKLNQMTPHPNVRFDQWLSRLL